MKMIYVGLLSLIAVSCAYVAYDNHVSRRYDLVLSTATDDFVIDHDLTYDDCNAVTTPHRTCRIH